MKITTLRLGMLQTNCYVLGDDTGVAAVVDPGGRITELKDYIDHHGLRVKKIVLTHGHADHIAGAMELKRESGADIHMHAADRGWLTAKDDPMARHLGLTEDIALDAEVAEGDTLVMAGVPFIVLHTPGHTPGGCCFYSAEQNTLLSGDTLFAGSIGRSDLVGGDALVLQKSLDRLKLLPDETKVFPGHGPSTTIALERKRNRLW